MFLDNYFNLFECLNPNGSINGIPEFLEFSHGSIERIKCTTMEHGSLTLQVNS